MIRIRAVGDLMPGGILNKKNCQFLSNEVADYLKDADIRIGTLECGIGNEPAFCPIKKAGGSSAFVYAEDNDLKRIVELGINAVSLANNHFFDLGLNGALHAIDLLEKHGISYFGAGMNIEEARKPAVFNISGKTVAFLGFCDTTIPFCQIANETSPGVSPLEEKNIIKSVKEAKSKYDFVFAVVHWGKEHTWWPKSSVVNFAKIFQKSGISGIIGGHPHRVQAVCSVKKTPVAYSLGNFLFPDRVINTPYVTYYPSEEESINKMKKVQGFTRVQEPSLKLWPDIANIGMILEINLKDSSAVMNYKLTQISHDGFIGFMNNPLKIKIVLNTSKYLIMSSLYPFFISTCDFIIRTLKIIIPKFKRIFLKIILNK